MNPVAAGAVIERIEAARRARPGGALAFDGDGTLWSGDVGDDFFAALLATGRIEPPAVEAMLALARRYGVPVPEGGPGLPGALHDAYVAGKVPEEPVYEMMAYACAGWSVDDVGRLARDVVAARGGLALRFHPETAMIARWAAAAGVEAFVVSASPAYVVVEAAAPLGFDAAHVVAAVTVVAGGVQRAAVISPIPYGKGKVMRLVEKLGHRPLYAAFGDNAFDVPLLQRAELGVAVRPKARLRERAGDVPGLVELTPE